MAIHELRQSVALSGDFGEPGPDRPTHATIPQATAPEHPLRRTRRNDPFPKLQIVWISIDDVVSAGRRVRRASRSQAVAVQRSMERFGNRIPILVRGKNAEGQHEAIDGHARLAAARHLGAELMPCLVVDDLPEIEIRRLALSLNKLQERGEWDQDELRVEIAELISVGNDFEFPGFEIAEIEALLLDASDATEDPADEILDSTACGPTVSRPGDVWFLGEHRVVCGSARDVMALAHLTAGRQVDVVWTDPPYNVKINGHVRTRATGFAEFAEGSGEMSRDEFVAFLAETLGQAASHLKPGGMVYACMDWRHVSEMSEALARIGLTLMNICVWVKTHPGQGSLYRSQHELVFVARKPGARHRNNVELGVHGRNRSNVWNYAGATGGKADGDDDFAVHPTVKPIRLIRDALLDVTIPGEWVLDPFLGSGSTLLAAERTRRCCIGIEIEPAYVDLAIRRWQEMTGGSAFHAESGLSFEAMAALRHDDVASGEHRDRSEAIIAPELLHGKGEGV